MASKKLKKRDLRAGLYRALSFCPRSTTAGLIATAVVILSSSGPAPQSQNQPDWRALAMRYEAGQHEVVAAAFLDALATPTALARFARDADKTTAGLAPAVAATFLLEAAMAAYAHDPNGALGLIEKGRVRIKGARRDIELAWHHAATAWLQGPYPADLDAREGSSVAILGGAGKETPDVTTARGDDYFKHRDAWVVSGGTAKENRVTPFLEHALRRFPDDWDLQLARAVFDAKSVFNYLKTLALVLQAPLPNPTRFGFAHADVRKLAESFAAVVAQAPEQQRPRADLYLGFLRYYDVTPRDGFRLRPEEALPLWREAARSTDPDVVYVALILQASVLWRQQGELATAIEALQKAHALFPGAQTAPRLLASLLYLGGSADAAGAVIGRMLDMPPGHDPWVGFFRGDFDRSPSRLAALRALLN